MSDGKKTFWITFGTLAGALVGFWLQDYMADEHKLTIRRNQKRIRDEEMAAINQNQTAQTSPQPPATSAS